LRSQPLTLLGGCVLFLRLRAIALALRAACVRSRSRYDFGEWASM
jgi:hypothetical protein